MILDFLSFLENLILIEGKIIIGIKSIHSGFKKIVFGEIQKWFFLFFCIWKMDNKPIQNFEIEENKIWNWNFKQSNLLHSDLWNTATNLFQAVT